MTLGLQPSKIPIFQPSHLLIFQPFPKVSRNRRNNKISWKVIISRDFVVSLFLDTFEYGKCPETGDLTKFFEYFKGFCRFTVSRHFWIRKVSINMRNDQILWTQKSQETWKRPNSLSTECSYKREKRPNLLNTESKHFRDKHWKQKKRPNLLTTKVSRNMETANSFEYGM